MYNCKKNELLFSINVVTGYRIAILFSISLLFAQIYIILMDSF